MEIAGLFGTIAFCEAKGMSNCFKAYSENCAGEEIIGMGFNPNSGYTYISLENGVTICSMLGRDVEFSITNFGDGEELFFDVYQEALNYEFKTEEESE